MKRRLAIAAVLGVVLLAAVALAFEWQWYCKAPGCGASGTAYYTCPTHGVFSTRAYGTDQRVGPPDRYCPICNQQCSAASAVCNGPSHHRYYKPGWIGY